MSLSHPGQHFFLEIFCVPFLPQQGTHLVPLAVSLATRWRKPLSGACAERCAVGPIPRRHRHPRRWRCWPGPTRSGSIGDGNAVGEAAVAELAHSCRGLRPGWASAKMRAIKGTYCEAEMAGGIPPNGARGLSFGFVAGNLSGGGVFCYGQVPKWTFFFRSFTPCEIWSKLALFSLEILKVSEFSSFCA